MLDSTKFSRWRWTALCLFLSAATLAAPAFAAETAPAAEKGAAAEDNSPEALVRETSREVLDLIAEGKSYAKQDPERFYGEVQALLSPVVDFESFARSVMAVHYRDATPEQRKRFADNFERGLVRTYALALTEFEDGKVDVVPPDRPPRNPKRRTVTMNITAASGEVYPVLYSMKQEEDGTWKVGNLIVNGVNMGLTYRNQFNSAMNDPKYGGDMDRVIDGWGELLKSEAPAIEAEAGSSGEPGR